MTVLLGLILDKICMDTMVRQYILMSRDVHFVNVMHSYELEIPNLNPNQNVIAANIRMMKFCMLCDFDCQAIKTHSK